MTQNKQNAKKTWLPLICVTVMSSGAVMAEPDAAPSLNLPPPIQVQQAPLAAAADGRFTSIIAKLAQDFPSHSTAKVLVIDATAQKLFLLENGVETGAVLRKRLVMVHRWALFSKPAKIRVRKYKFLRHREQIALMIT
jgi:hypothetical protein